MPNDKMDRCKLCQAESPWEWVPEVMLDGYCAVGTGIWQRPLISGLCRQCQLYVLDAGCHHVELDTEKEALVNA